MKNLISLVATLALLLGVTSLTILYSQGWRIGLGNNGSEINTSRPVVKRTGMLAIRSIPEGAKIYINDEPEAVTATDDTLSSLIPQKYNIRLEREGFETWEKEVDVFPELVTDITAVLVLQSPRLEPLTNTDVKAYSLSSNQNSIAFLTKNHKEPGIWVLPLSGSPINIFGSNSQLLVADTPLNAPSSGEAIWWSPDDKEILVKINETGYLLYDLGTAISRTQTPTVQAVTNVETVFNRWNEEWQADFLETKIESIKSDQEIPEWVVDAALNQETFWAPDTDKFFFTIQDEENPNNHKLIVYNSETPLPVGEKRIYETANISDLETTKFYWYSDSYHLIQVTKVPNTENNYTVSLIRIDGSNPTLIYTGALASNQAYPTPGGDKIVVLTWLKDRSQTNIYAISIR